MTKKPTTGFNTIDDSKAPVTYEIATYEKDHDLFSGYLNYLLNPDKVLQLECGGRISVYDDIGRDTHIAGELRTRALAVVGKEWEVVPGTEGISGAGRQEEKAAQKIADYIKQVFLSFEYDTARRSVLRGGILKGYAVSEIMWDVSEGDVFIKSMEHRSQHRFVFTHKNELRLLTPQNLVTGEAVPTRKFQTFCFGDEPTTPYGTGLGRELYWPWWFKKNGIKFWLIFCDKFGSPTPIGKYPPGTLEDKRDELLRACNALQTDSGVIIPDTMNLELLEAARAGSINTYESLCSFMNSEMSKSILGQTLTTEIGDTGSYAASQTHNEVRLDIVKADADILSSAMSNRVIRWLVDYNFGPQRFYPKMWIKTQPPDDLKVRSEVDRAIFSMGYRPQQEYIEETYSVEVEDIGVGNPPYPPLEKGGIDQREKGGNREEEETPDAFAEHAKRCHHCFAGNHQGLFPDQHAIDTAIDSLTPDDLQAQMEGILKPVIDMLREERDYNVILEKLSEAYPNMDDKAIEEMLTRAIFVSELWGRLNARG